MVETSSPSESPSVFLDKIAGSSLPIAVAHGEGRAVFSSSEDLESLENRGGVVVRYVDNEGKRTERYPFNPNGSPNGIAGVQSRDGRVLAMMPHPERTVLAGTGSWVSESLDKERVGAWAALFKGARNWVG
jgi:phosphoribosylformylglycinamidine synthase